MVHKISLYLAAALLLVGSATLSAQTSAPKYGHMNLGNVLEQLPDTKKANETLKAFTDKLTAKDDSLNRAFQAAYTQLETEYKAGGLTPVQVQQREAQLQKQQEAIQAFEADAQKQVATRREELLKPILTTIEEAIKAVAKENGYLMIFDTSSGAMLFAAETEDVTALVKKKMGL
jgi:outer membrane protein